MRAALRRGGVTASRVGLVSPNGGGAQGDGTRVAAGFESRNPSREGLWLTAAGLLLTLLFCWFYLRSTVVMNEADPRLLAQFAAHRPYQLRILTPFLAHWMARLSGGDVVECFHLITIAFALGLFGSFRAYLRHFSTERAANWLALTLLFPLAAFYSHRWFYPYDVPAAFFTALGLLWMAQGKWKAYLALFVLATLNRESSAFLTLIFVLTQRDQLPRRALGALLGAQIGLWLAIRWALSLAFAGNAGAGIEWHWRENLDLVLHFGRAANLQLGAATAMLLGLWAVGALTRRYQPRFVCRARGAFWPFLLSMGVVGVWAETRLFSELIPILLAPVLLGAWNWTQARSA